MSRQAARSNRVATEPGRLFQPFVTLNKGGPDLGLVLVHQAVKDHGGHICIEPSDGAREACFCFLQPSNPPAADRRLLSAATSPSFSINVNPRYCQLYRTKTYCPVFCTMLVPTFLGLHPRSDSAENVRVARGGKKVPTGNPPHGLTGELQEVIGEAFTPVIIGAAALGGRREMPGYQPQVIVAASEPDDPIVKALAVAMWDAALYSTPGVFDRLAFLGGLKDATDCKYHHWSLARSLGDEEADRIIRRDHEQAFNDWLAIRPAERAANLKAALGRSHGQRWLTLSRWTRLSFQLSLVPESATEDQLKDFLATIDSALEFMSVEKN